MLKSNIVLLFFQQDLSIQQSLILLSFLACRHQDLLVLRHNMQIVEVVLLPKLE